jgi:hypothetical protein
MVTAGDRIVIPLSWQIKKDKLVTKHRFIFFRAGNGIRTHDIMLGM